jgi:hypothetical protein
MFYSCTSLKSVAAMDVRSMVDGPSLFAGCTALEESPELSGPSAVNIYQMFDKCSKLYLVRSISFPKAGNWFAFFRNCRSIEVLDHLDCQGATSLECCFECSSGGGSLLSLQAIPASLLTSADKVLYGQTKLVDFGGFTGITTSFSLSSCTALSRESLLAVLDGLARVSGETTLTLGAANRAKLTEEELQVAVDKGWTVQ